MNRAILKLTLFIWSVAELHYKLSTTSKIYPSPPGKLEEKADLNVRIFGPALYNQSNQKMFHYELKYLFCYFSGR